MRVNGFFLLANSKTIKKQQKQTISDQHQDYYGYEVIN